MEGKTFEKYEVLRHLASNQLTKSVLAMVPEIHTSACDQTLFDLNFNFFVFRKLKISAPSNQIHQKLLCPETFARDKVLLSRTRPESGVILLPISMPFYHGQEPKGYANAILYSWLSHNEHFKVAGLNPKTLKSTIVPGRSLLILPIQKNRFVAEEETNHLYCCDSSFILPRILPSPYAKMQDYVMSMILFNSHKKIYDQILFEERIKRQKLLLNTNMVELIST